MPSTSKAQQRMMAAAANNPAVAKKMSIPQSVAADFFAADRAKGGKALKKLPERASKKKGK